MNIQKEHLSGYDYIYAPGASESTVTLLLLHGTGGDEYDLLPVGAELAPGAPLISPRGNVLEHGAARFFRRLAEGVFDEADVRRRAVDLAGFIQGALFAHNLGGSELAVAGYSNGANIAAAVLLSVPTPVKRAVLLRPMMPFREIEKPVELEDTSVLLLNGTNDSIIPRSEALRLAAALEEAGAEVRHEWIDTGHNLTRKDLELARAWMAAA